MLFPLRLTARRSGSMARPGAPRLQQRLALQLLKIGISRLGCDQRVDLLDRVGHVAEAIGGDGAGILRGERGVGERILAVDHVRPLHKAHELRAHHVVPDLEGRRVLGVVIGARLGELFQRRDAFARHGMVQQIGIDPLGDEQLLALEPLEGLDHPLCRLMCLGEVFDRRAVRGRFLTTLIGEK